MKTRCLHTILCLTLSLGAAAQEEGYPMPHVPDTLLTAEARADYVAHCYWDRYDFSDTTLIHRGTLAEQAVSNFLAILAYASEAGRQTGIKRWLDGASQNSTTLSYFSDMASKYLYDTGSPLRNDDLYRLVLTYVSNSPAADEAMMSRAQFEQQLLCGNSVGTMVTDFEYLADDGQKRLLSQTATDRLTLLLFYDPDCRRCQDLMFRLRHSSVVNQAIAENRLALLKIDTEQNIIATQAPYDLRTLPLMFLLAPDKRVLLRDADYHQLTEYLLAQ